MKNTENTQWFRKKNKKKKTYPKKSFALLQTIFVVPKNKYVVPIFWIYMKKKT